MTTKLLRLMAAAGFVVAGTEALAQPMSLPEQQVEAKRLSSLCNSDATYVGALNQAKAGSQRASYEAAAALIQCFYDHVDARYPAEQKQKWLEAIEANKKSASQLQ